MLGPLARLFRRNASTMATTKAPVEPLLVVLGSTGTGKSDVSCAAYLFIWRYMRIPKVHTLS